MEAPGLWQRELKQFGTVASGDARYRMHWTGDPMPGFPEHKFAAPIDCWALLWWVDQDSERPGAGGGYAVLQAFYTQDSGVFVPTMLETVGLNLKVVTMMAGEAEKHRHDFAKIRHRQLERQRATANEAISGRIADILQDAMPQFTGPTSFGAAQGALPTVVERKVEQIERNLATINRRARQMRKGPAIAKAEA